MNRIAFLGIIGLFPVLAFGQIDLEKVAKRQKVKTEKKIENRIEKKVDKGVDKALDKTEEGITETVSGDASSNSAQQKSKNKNKVGKQEPAGNEEKEKESVATESAEKSLVWNQYDFIPGNEIIFEDNLAGEKNGEFPSKWDLSHGTIENAIFDGESVIFFRQCNINGLGGIVPLIKDSQNDYLPEEFTIEFDAYFYRPTLDYRINFLDVKNQKQIYPDNNVSKRPYLKFSQIAVSGTNINTSYYPGANTAHLKIKPGWRHFSISFNIRALKVYIDDARVLNIPNLGFNPAGVTLGFHNPSANNDGYVKNFKIAKGAVPLYDKFLTDGKFITTGIKFDINKASI